MNNKFLKINDGYAALTTTVITLVVSLTILGGLTFFSLKEVSVNRTFTKSIESEYISEGGIEDAVYRIVSGKQIGTQEILNVGSGSTTVLVTTLGNQKTVRSEGKRENIQQNLETKINIPIGGGFTASFSYGAQIGSGGVEMSQNSQIQGSVYSNGRIKGPSGGSNVLITGNVFAAGSSAIEHVIINGNARANSFDDSIIGGVASSTTNLCCIINGNAYANTLNGAIVGTNPLVHEARANNILGTIVNGKCYYQTQDDDIICLGGEFPNNPFTPPTNLPALDLPILDSQINQWKTDAAVGGTVSGDYTVSDNVSLGPKKIIGNLLMTANNKTLTVTGTIYVQGNIDISNGSTIRCASAYGADSCLVLSDGWVRVANNSGFGGSGTPGSFLLLLSTATGGGEDGSAIKIKNNASGVIFYAGNGLIYLNNNVTVTDVVGKELNLQNGAKVIYDTALSNVNFGGGGGGGAGGYDVQYWKEVE